MRLETCSRLPESNAHATPILFVHGAWHAAWCWQEHFMDYFAQRGYAAYAFDLRGHGGSDGHGRLRWARISEYVADAAQIVQQLPAPPVVIGHSMGGLVAQKYLEMHTAPAGVLLASVPPAGVLATTLRIARRHPLEFARVNLTWRLYPLVATPRLAREAFFSASLPEEQLQVYAKRLQDESFLGFLDMLALNLPRPHRVKTPMLVLGAANDTIFHPNEIEATARAYNTSATVFPDMAHDMMLEAGWQAVADKIIAWLGERGI